MHSRKMWKSIILLICLSGYCCAGPLGQKKNMPIMQRDGEPMIKEAAGSEEAVAEKPMSAQETMLMSTLTLPSNATSIRADITDNFSCDDKAYGYYADVENDCQIFHVCLPVTYADGKENTFRWSFICPEETVFSQDSFTCMRPEDMSIECEESHKYYELNRNFGMIESESNNNNNNMASDHEDAMPAAAEAQPQIQSKPVMREDEKVQMAAAPVQMQAQSMKDKMNEKEKPVKVQKPNRRKPAISFSAQKKPATHPLRKVPQTNTVATAEVLPEKQVVEIVKTEEEATEVKPVVQRFKKRPTHVITLVKEKPQTTSILVEKTKTPLRTDIYNQIRKRPTFANKQETVFVDTKTVPENTPEVVVAETPISTLVIKSETAPIPDALPADTTTSDVKLVNTANAIIEPDSSASETAITYIKPAEVVKDADENKPEETVLAAEPINLDSTKTKATELIATETVPAPLVEETVKAEQPLMPIEAIEEIPAVIAEVEENQLASNDKNMLKTEPILVVDENKPSLHEEQVTIDEAPIKPEIVEPTFNKVELTNEPMEVVPLKLEDNKVKTVTEDMPQVIETQPMSTNTAAVPQDMPVDVPATNVNESEELIKPIESAEVMPVADEVENADTQKETMGGFKPVDPAMAAEAEALITDFLNTLKKTDADMQPIMPGDIMPETIKEATENQETMNSSEPAAEVEQLKGESNGEEPTSVEKMVMPEETPNEMLEKSETSQPIPADNVALKSSSETADSIEEQTSVEVVPMPNKELNAFPSEMYQIPVQVIAAPIEDMLSAGQLTEKENKSQENVDSVESHLQKKLEEETENKKLEAETETEDKLTTTSDEENNKKTETNLEPEKSAYAPLSIDDIVELVKERLDQLPASDKKKPIELVMKNESEENQNEEPLKTLTENSEEQGSPEVIIMPIYHRTQDTNENTLKTQSALTETETDNLPASSTLTETKVEPENETLNKAVQTEEVAEPIVSSSDTAKLTPETTEENEKTSRFYRARNLKNSKMDPRKRRFLFRSDAS
ncbi:mucin-17 [Teleopsis dalmanni]|uniref:mucin-17 n=1 Tax=Teleopsis dalmanni TaxID=139649 RepID=UPI0018CEA824|nr:mucin-17 [Teleopsis dalmanni]